MKRKITKTIVRLKRRVADSRQENERNPGWVKQVAFLTGILAAISGFLDVRSTEVTNDAIYQSNLAILSQTQASDAWSEYQADSIKAHIAEVALESASALPADKSAKLEMEEEDMRARQDHLKQEAAHRIGERDDHLKGGTRLLSEKDLLSYAGLASQIGIALASVAAMIRWRVPFVAGVVAGSTGLLIACIAMAQHYGLLPV
jgi:hypothetical protein